MKTIDQIIDEIIKVEGGYSNHKADAGGATMYGITEAVARANGYKGDMKLLPKETAKAIYLNKYFLQPKLNLIFDVNQEIAAKMMDICVNMGEKWPKLWLQQALNLFNRNGQDYAKIEEDGVLGKGTVAALKALLAKRGSVGVDIILKRLNVAQGCRYEEICKARPANYAFLVGWYSNRVGV